MKLTKLIARVLAPVLMFVGLSIAPASAVVGTAMTLTYDLSKISPSLTVGLPFYGAVSATINWGDGTTNTNATYGAVFSHTYATSGIYTISISGTMQHFGYDNIVNHPSCSVGGAVQCPGIAALTAVTSWGSIPFTSLNYAFAKAINLTDVPADFPSTVTKTTGMFYQASKINDSDISGWSMGNVTNMSAMFAGTDLFNQPLNSWDVSKVTTFEQMFAYTKVFNQPLNSWDTSSATVMSTMFFSAEAFNQNISNWDTSKVTLMVSMFQGQVYRNPFNNGGQPLAPNGVHWDTSLVTKMDAMFSYSSFTQDVSTWKTSSLQSASNMFYSNSTYNVDVSAWDISKLQGPAVNKQYYTLASMFYGTAFSTTNYDKLLNSWVDQDHTAGQTNGVYFGAQQTKYSCAGLYAREKLRSTYNWTFVDNGPTTACTLYVVPDAIRVTEGDPVPTYTFKYYADAAHTQELTAPLVTSAPTCSSDYVAEMVIADSARTITCSGGDAGSAFVYDFSATAQVRIGGPIVTLYVVPDNQNITEGDAVPASSFYTYTLHTGSASGPTVTPTVATAPTCTSTYAITMTNAVTPSVNITCSGGSDPDYTFDTTATATLTIDPAGPDYAFDCSVGNAGANYPNTYILTPGEVVTFEFTNCVWGYVTGATTPSWSGGAALPAGVTAVAVSGPGSINFYTPGQYRMNWTFAYAAPTVTSISPSHGTVNGGTSVTITGTGFRSGAAVTIGGTACTSVTVVSATSVTCTTPAGTAGTASVRVVNDDLQEATLAAAYTYDPAPVVTSVSPSAGALAGGTAITITGTGFMSGATVTVGGVACTSATVVSSTSITCTTGAHAAGTVDVVVTSNGETATLSNGFTYQAAPTVTSVSPSIGDVGGGTSVTITGTGFVSGATVTLGGVACTSVTVVSSTSITCTTGAHAAGAVTAAVTNTDGQSGSASSAYTYAVTPTVSSVSPSGGPIAGGTNITITGSNFEAGATVTVGGSACTSVVVVSATSITCTTPAGSAGSANVVVTNTNTMSGTGTSLYSYNAPPTVTGVSPSSGSVVGGTTITISGTGFLAGASVNVGGIACTSVNVVSSTSITCVTPAGAAGAVNIEVINTDAQSATGSLLYTYVSTPTITSVTPNTGPAAGGTAITITGTNFLNGTTVTIGGVACTSIVIVSDTTITCITPANTAGAKSVVVTSPDLQSVTATNAFTYQAPIVVGICAAGDGKYTVGGKVTDFHFEINGSVGTLSWGQAGYWKFEGTITSAKISSGVVTATGTGELYYWKKSGKTGSWVAATSGKAKVTLQFSPKTTSPKAAAKIAVGFTGTKVSGSPTLPALPSRTAISSGSIEIS